MTRRIAATFGLIAFALCLAQGLVVENSFSTVIWRGLQALVVSLMIGGLIGVMFDKMLSENLVKTEGLEDSSGNGEKNSR